VPRDVRESAPAPIPRQMSVVDDEPVS
jgi:hypothetical protein